MDYQTNRIQWTPRLCGGLITLITLWLALNMLTPAHAGKASYSIQIGAFKEQRYAIKELSKLKGSGRNVFYRHEEIENRGKWYRVYVNTYRERSEAEREARRLMKLGLVKDYTIRKLIELEEAPSKKIRKKNDASFVITGMTLIKEKGGAETLLIHSNRSFWPVVHFALEEEIPRLVINIDHAKSVSNNMPDTAFQGELIKGVRNQFKQSEDNLKIILDLASDRKYEVTQVFNEVENIYKLKIGERKTHHNQ